MPCGSAAIASFTTEAAPAQLEIAGLAATWQPAGGGGTQTTIRLQVAVANRGGTAGATAVTAGVAFTQGGYAPQGDFPQGATGAIPPGGQATVTLDWPHDATGMLIGTDVTPTVYVQLGTGAQAITTPGYAPGAPGAPGQFQPVQIYNGTCDIGTGVPVPNFGCGFLWDAVTGADYYRVLASGGDSGGFVWIVTTGTESGLVVDYAPGGCTGWPGYVAVQAANAAGLGPLRYLSGALGPTQGSPPPCASE